VSGSVTWEAVTSGGTVSRVEFSIDGVLRWTESSAPYVFNGDGGTWNTTLESDGPHTLSLRAVASDGSEATNSISVTVANGSGGTSTTVYPASTTIQKGTLRAGSATRLTSDDNSYYQVNSTTSLTRTVMWYGTFTVPNELTSLSVTYKGKNSASCSQQLAVLRVTDNVWVQLDSRSVGTTEVSVTKAASGTLANYVTGTTGNGQLKVRVRCTKSSNFYSSADLMQAVYQTT
jgi:hypothetical protein